MKYVPCSQQYAMMQRGLGGLAVLAYAIDAGCQRGSVGRRPRPILGWCVGEQPSSARIPVVGLAKMRALRGGGTGRSLRNQPRGHGGAYYARRGVPPPAHPPRWMVRASSRSPADASVDVALQAYGRLSVAEQRRWCGLVWRCVCRLPGPQLSSNRAQSVAAMETWRRANPAPTEPPPPPPQQARAGARVHALFGRWRYLCRR